MWHGWGLLGDDGQKGLSEELACVFRSLRCLLSPFCLQVVGSQARILYSDQKGRVAIAVAFNQAIAQGKIKVTFPGLLGGPPFGSFCQCWYCPMLCVCAS